MLQVTAHRPDRNLQAEALPQKELHRLARPQCERQAQLVRAVSDDQFYGQRRLQWLQLRADRTAALGATQGAESTFRHGLHPPIHRRPRHAEGAGSLRLRKSLLADGLHHPPAEVGLRGRGQAAGVVRAHEHAYAIPRYELVIYCSE